MKPIYLDYQSTTPVDDLVIKKMLPYFTNLYGNPHSINHVFGKKAKEAIEESRKMIANTIGANTASFRIHNETGGNIANDTGFTASFVVL